ncbi:hypothetical protein [Sorangium sp. So ce1097]|uniref:hypothetical protein n=1 Tax=Sorangium sp. So ce1097 TaxID=3133330 RepID=UPI003F60C754
MWPSQLLLDVNWEFRDGAPGPNPWWKDRSTLGTIIRSASELDLFPMRWVGSGRKLAEIKSLDALIEDSTSWQDRSYMLHSRKQGGLEGSSLELSLREGLLRLYLTISDEDVARRKDSLCDGMIELVVRSHRALAKRAMLAEMAGIRVPELEYPRPRPPREHPTFAMGVLATFIDPAHLALRDEKFPEEHLARDLAKVRKARLPEGASREERDGLIVLRWLDGPPDEDSARRACSLSEDWFARTLDPPIAPQWNDLGDQEVDVAGFESHPPLTLYDEATERGLKALAVPRSGKAPRKELDELARWARAGKLPDGTPLAELGVILSSREAALALHDRLTDLGVAPVVYTDKDGTLWDPFPPGEWIE